MGKKEEINGQLAAGRANSRGCITHRVYRPRALRALPFSLHRQHHFLTRDSGTLSPVSCSWGAEGLPFSRAASISNRAFIISPLRDSQII